ncbi:hypothetical protein GCM10010954_11690 [Halobacillus andaensis]|uniref:DUF1572 domain-containing protein n=1 Tax=Halobacillus andaensis TaxID=1176239 RepID=A0A917B0L1_HALAA|nr:DUF1572 family protein [Halobacillus andaensis]MBP2003965.1 hypothetical protein [Halobacillus andaensis]GGF14780.1 hypothetical protein GCM10010954_11690 [Halobacillus andaensis]
MNVEKEYLKVVQERFHSVKELGEKTITQLSEEEIQWYMNDASNSIAVLVKHLNGNMKSRWIDFFTSDGEKPNRNRDQEFINTISSKEELIEVWEEGWEILFDTLNNLRPADLTNHVKIRSENHTVIDAIERQVVHYASHIGQIVYIGKLLKGEEWHTLSIPKGKSEEYFEYMRKEHE